MEHGRTGGTGPVHAPQSGPGNPAAGRPRHTRLRRITGLLSLLVAGLVTAIVGTAAGGQEVAGGPILELYEITGTSAELTAATQSGAEILRPVGADGDVVTVRAVVPIERVARLRDAGIEIEAVERAAAIEGRQAGDFNVWRPWSGTDGIRAEMEAVAAANRSLTKLVTLGESVQGEPIYAIKVTQNARSVADGSRPSSGYISAQHAREWITVEANRRFMHHLLDNYGSDPEITELLNTTEVWFVLVANPDGYDYTFTNDRLWRKNLADNNNSGTISFFDGVDLNRNFAEKWGYDNEGSSGATSSEVYRGTAPMSEPETQAMDALFALAGFEYFFNIHSAVGIMLYGNGSIVAAESPDDHIGEVLIGTDASPAIPGYNPGVSAELYIVNGDTNDYMQNAYGGFAVVMELETCDQAEALILNDAFGPNFCESEGRSVFEFPDNEALIEMVFQRNLPLYLSGAQSAALGDDPISQDGRRTPDIVLDDLSLIHI